MISFLLILIKNKYKIPDISEIVVSLFFIQYFSFALHKIY